MALTATVAEGLDYYQVGPKLRALRTMRKMGLVELAKHTGLSAALISKIERSKMYPTLPTLLRIALVFNVGLDYFFVQDRKSLCVVRKRDRQPPNDVSADAVRCGFEALEFAMKDRVLDAYVAEFDSRPVDDVKLHTHVGMEFLFVLEGKLGLYIEDGETVLGAEDAAYFDAGRMHGYRRIGRAPCRALSVVASRSTAVAIA